MALASLSSWSQLLHSGFTLASGSPPLPQGEEGGANLRRAVPGSLGCSVGSLERAPNAAVGRLKRMEHDGPYDCMSGAARLMSR